MTHPDPMDRLYPMDTPEYGPQILDSDGEVLFEFGNPDSDPAKIPQWWKDASIALWGEESPFYEGDK